MKFAVVSDSHDNLATLEKCVSWLNREKIGLVLHCGDVCSPSMLKEMSQSFKGEVHLAFGNVDGDTFSMLKAEREGKLPNVKFYGDYGELEIDGKKIGFCHAPLLARGMAAKDEYDLVFYGHTHQPWEERVGNCRLVNPGTLSGMFNKATFAVYDTITGKLELKLIEKL